MNNGIYQNPTTVFFGKDVELLVGKEIKKYSKKILLHYGNSFKKYGLYGKVVNLLKSAGIEFVEAGGVESNPKASLVYKYIKVCRKEKINFILAVGGGSAIDSAKAIAIGVPYKGDFFDFFLKKEVPKKSLKVGVILTIFGSGSETGSGVVITHTKLQKKYDCASPVIFPVFAMMNPEITFTVPRNYINYGIVDAISHVLERYFTNTLYVDCTDRICEGLIQTLMKYAVLMNKDPYNYDIRAEIMWACKLAHDNTAGFGRQQDWACHKISHEIEVRYGIAHGAILAVIFPNWMEYVSKINKEKFIQFANKVFNINTNIIRDEKAISMAIKKYRSFLKKIGMPENLKELGVIKKSEFSDIAQKCVSLMPSGTIGNFVRLSPNDIISILNLSFKR